MLDRHGAGKKTPHMFKRLMVFCLWNQPLREATDSGVGISVWAISPAEDRTGL
jgi:hypothetical protein